MASIYDFLPPGTREQAGYAGLGALAQALLQGGAPTTTPGAGISALGAGFGGFGQAYNARLNSGLQQAGLGMQLAKAKRDEERDQQWRAMWGGAVPPVAPPQNAPQMASADPTATAGALTPMPGDRAGPTPAAAGRLPMPASPMAGIDPSLRPVLATMGPEQGAAFLAQQMAKSPTVSEFYDSQGRPYKAQYTPGRGWVPVGGAKTPDWQNPAYVAAQKEIRAAGKPDVSVKVDNKMGESLAKPVGEMVQQTRDGALGAIDTIETVNRIRESMGSANLGPTATIRQNVDRFAYMLGVGGASTAERLANTQSVVKGLAELTLSGRKALKGQGQVSDYEGKLLEKAASGNIDEMTAPELEKLMEVADRVARKQYGLHEHNMKALDETEYKGLAPFYRVPPLPEVRKSGAAGGSKRIRFDAQGNIIQ
jgi:hypothetical protein